MGCIGQRESDYFSQHEGLGLDQSALLAKGIDEVWDHAIERIYEQTAINGILFQIIKSSESVHAAGTPNFNGLFLFDLKNQQGRPSLVNLASGLAKLSSKVEPNHPLGLGKDAWLTMQADPSYLDAVFIDNEMRLSAPICWQPFPYKDVFQFRIVSAVQDNYRQVAPNDLLLLRLVLIDFSNAFLRSVYLGKQTGKPLTAKQLEILHLIGSERTDQEIADLLGISCSAVRRRIESIQIKFSTSKRLGLIVKAMRSGAILDTVLNDLA